MQIWVVGFDGLEGLPLGNLFGGSKVAKEAWQVSEIQ